MEKGYYVTLTSGVELSITVAIHNKNGKGLLLNLKRNASK